MQPSRGSKGSRALRRTTWIVCASLLACVQTRPAAVPGPAFHVVALGDSYGSGQGAPDVDGSWSNGWTPTWEDRRCNRSGNAATAQAAALLRAQAQGHEIRYESFACSGASIEKGLIGPYAGSEPPNAPFPEEPLPAQVEALSGRIATLPVDAVTVSIGGNDILFQAIVVACLFEPSCELHEGQITYLLGELRARLVDLAAELKQVSIASDRIFIVGYPDPTRDDDGTPCDTEPLGDLLAGVSGEEAAWVADKVLPRLNNALCTAAQQNGWTYVGGAAERFAQHGWCARSEPWINTIGKALETQGHYRGAVHPNRAGHLAVGEEIAKAMTPLLTDQPPLSSECPAAPEGPLPPAPSS